MFKEAQQEVGDWAETLEKPYWQPLSQLARATEEMGELARLVNHIYGDKPKKPNEARQEMGAEIMDVMFALLCLANNHQIDLDAEFAKTMEKSRIRDQARFAKKNSNS